MSKRQQIERRKFMGKLSNKVAVVTGSSKGIGAGIAKGLAAEGAAVVVNYASSKEGAERVVSEIKAKGGKAIAVHGDVAKAKDVQRLFAETKKASGCAGEQCGRLRVCPPRAGYRATISPHVRHECSGAHSDHAGSSKALRCR